MKKIITTTFFGLLICMLLGTSLGEAQARYSTQIQKSNTITETKDDQTLTTAVSVSVGSNHTCALTTEGGVKCWGANYYGQLGNDSIVESPTPVDVLGFTNEVVIAVSAGYAHTCAVTLAGDVWCWGNNDDGQLGDATFTDRHTPVIVDGFTEKVIAISAGRFYTCALTSSGGIKCWGDNSDGQLGYTSTTTCDYGPCSNIPMDVVGFENDAENAIAISAGAYHTCALTSGGGVKCWGNNGDGQLGDGTTDNRPIPEDVSGLTSRVKAVSAGGTHTCAVTNQGKVKCWGDNEDSKLGDTSIIDRHTPVLVGALSNGMKAISAGDYHTCALSAGGAVKCWGVNDFGQLGDGTTTRLIPPEDVIGLASGVVEVSANYQYTCALTDTGGVKYWGNRFFGSNDPGSNFENTNSSIPVDVEGLTSGVQAISTGKYHTCAVTEAGGVKCWGYNGVGQLGDGTTNDSLTPVDVVELTDVVVTDISAGDDHTCALTEDGEVKCWGKNFSGQLGNGETINSSTPEDVIGLTDVVVVDISASAYHTCALTESGGVKCWGGNSDGQLGDGTTETRTAPVDVDGLTNGVIKVSTGEDHTCAITDTYGVKCWGSNQNGQLGDGTADDSSTPVDVFGFTEEGEDASKISAGNRHTCVVTSSGAVKCWGDDWEGQLGTGTIGYESLFPVDVVGLSDGVKAVSAGTNHTCAITEVGSLKCWGDNTHGQVGWKLLWVPVDVIGFVENFMLYLPMIDR